jgi:hypothetical protein
MSNGEKVVELAAECYPHKKSSFERLVQLVADAGEHLAEDTHGKLTFTELSAEVENEIKYRKEKRVMNSIRVIHPYWHDGILVFDDPSVGLVKEAFVAGADTAIASVAATVPGCEEKFSLLFSHLPFPGHQAHARLLRPESGGHWYEFEGSGIQGWLCPALLKYFEAAPKDIYIEVRNAEDHQK